MDVYSSNCAGTFQDIKNTKRQQHSRPTWSVSRFAKQTDLSLLLLHGAILRWHRRAETNRRTSLAFSGFRPPAPPVTRPWDTARGGRKTPTNDEKTHLGAANMGRGRIPTNHG